MMDDVKAEEAEEGEVDENGLPISNKRVCCFFLTRLLRFFPPLEVNFLTLHPFLFIADVQQPGPAAEESWRSRA